MGIKTRSMTFARIIANHGQTIANIVQQPATSDPASFTEQVQAAADLLSAGTTSSSQDDGDTLNSASAYLTDALAVDDSNPERSLLLRRANQHLNDIDTTDYL